MRRILTDLRILASVALMGGLLAVALWPRAIEVDLARVSRGPLVVTIEEEGRTRVRDRFIVTAPLDGRALRIELEPGDRVTRGDVIARLQPTGPPLLDARMRAQAMAAMRSAEASLGQARADEARACAALALAHRNLLRSRQLDAAGGTSSQEIESRETEVSIAAEAAKAAAFAVRAASAEVERATTRMKIFVETDSGESVIVRAPVDGVVLRRFRESEGTLPAGEPLAEIGDVRQLEIVTDLLSTDAVHVTPGAAAGISSGDIALDATVRRIEPAGFSKISALGVDEQRVRIVLDFMEAGEVFAPLGDAYRVDTRIVLWQAANVLKVPTSALVRDGARWSVYVASEGRARRTIVALGRHTAQEAEVRSGLLDGVMVVVHPSDLMHDGVRIVNRATR